MGLNPKPCAHLGELRTLVGALTSKELLDCARAQGKLTEAAMRKWAGDLVNNTPVRPLTQQPGTLEDVAGYTRSMMAQGHPPRFVIFAGLGTPGGPQQVRHLQSFHCMEPTILQSDPLPPSPLYTASPLYPMPQVLNFLSPPPVYVVLDCRSWISPWKTACRSCGWGGRCSAPTSRPSRG